MSATTLNSIEPTQRRKFQLTNLDGNNNKFYLIETWDLADGHVRLRATYGRVGARPQISDKIVDEATVERKSAVANASTPRLDLDPHVIQLVDWIYAEAGEHIASYLAVAVDGLSQEQIERGRALLALAVQQHTIWQRAQSQANFHLLAGTVQTYYNTIPTLLPARIDREKVVANFCTQFAEQEDRLNQLEAAIATQTVQQHDPLISRYEALGATITRLSGNDPACEQVHDYIARTAVHGYKIKVRDVFSVCVPEERNAFERNIHGRSRIELLFHGTANHNVRHILRSGLICPRTASHGRMFGHGIYFANKASKSANYCYGYRAPNILFLADVAIGTPFVAPREQTTLREPPRGYDSVLGKAGVTNAWGGKLHYDEFIVYRAAQQSLRYLVTFDLK